jgi:hypothetical protein
LDQQIWTNRSRAFPKVSNKQIIKKKKKILATQPVSTLKTQSKKEKQIRNSSMASSKSAIGFATNTKPHSPHLASLDDLRETVSPPPGLDCAQPAAWYFSLLLSLSLSLSLFSVFFFIYF